MGTYVITEPCIDVKDGTCVDVCPVACIHTTGDARQYFIDPDICIECEQCVIVCPVDAIYVDTEVPSQWAEYIASNAAFFLDNKPVAESITAQGAAPIVAAMVDYAERSSLALALVIVERDGVVVAQYAMPGSPESAPDEALARARKTVSTTARSPGSRPIFEHVDIIGSIGVAGGPGDEDALTARAGIAAWDSSAVMR